MANSSGRLGTLYAHLVPTAVVTGSSSSLSALGFRRAQLPATALSELAELGFCVLPGVVPPSLLSELRGRFDEIVAAERATTKSKRDPSEGDPGAIDQAIAKGSHSLLLNLVNKGRCFDELWRNPALLTLVSATLPGQFKLFSFNGLEPLPGTGEQGLHRDASTASHYSTFTVVNSIWCLDDFRVRFTPYRYICN